MLINRLGIDRGKKFLKESILFGNDPNPELIPDNAPRKRQNKQYWQLLGLKRILGRIPLGFDGRLKPANFCSSPLPLAN